MHESCYERLPGASMMSSPGREQDPTLDDSRHASRMVGTSFSWGSAIVSGKVRRVILI